jgi:hypothetical protein
MTVNDLMIFVVILIAIIFLAVKATKDYKILTTENSDNIYVNPRSFIWKSGIFLFIAVVLIPFSARKDISTYLLFFCLLGIGCWNIYYAVKYRNYIKKS